MRNLSGIINGEKTRYKKGYIPWNKKPKIIKECKVCKKLFPIVLSLKQKAKYCSRKCWYSDYPPQPKETREKKRQAGIKRWDKIGRKQKRPYRHWEHIEWRKKVYERDNYTCQRCKAKSGQGKKIYLEAHHIKSWAEFPKLRNDVENGITLCKDCHNKTRQKNSGSFKKGNIPWNKCVSVHRRR